MGFGVKSRIWDLFGDRANEKDLYKDENGRGLQQRFVELLAGDLDENELSLINNLSSNTRDPWTMFQRLLPYHEQHRGELPKISDDFRMRRKVLSLSRHLIERRGTKSGYEILFRIMGFDSTTIVEITNVSGFDSAVRFDDPFRRFDQKCKACSDYDIELTGSLSITPDILDYMFNVIEYNEPINAKLRYIFYNGGSVVGPGTDIIGDAITPSFPLPHNLDTRDVFVQVWEMFGDFRDTDVQVEREEIDQIRVSFVEAPTIGENYRVLIRDAQEVKLITGTGGATAFTLSHSLGTQFVMAQVYHNVEDYPTVEVAITNKSSTQTQVIFTDPVPAGEEYILLLLPPAKILSIAGDGVTKTFTLVHSFGSRDYFTYLLKKEGTDWVRQKVRVDRNDLDSLVVRFEDPPVSGEEYKLCLFS